MENKDEMFSVKDDSDAKGMITKIIGALANAKPGADTDLITKFALVKFYLANKNTNEEKLLKAFDVFQKELKEQDVMPRVNQALSKINLLSKRYNEKRDDKYDEDTLFENVQGKRIEEWITKGDPLAELEILENPNPNKSSGPSMK